MNFAAIERNCLRALGTFVAAAVLWGCSTPAVGAPCLPEQIPEDGFDEREAYVESSSVQCETRVCLVFKLKGDPRKECLTRAPRCPNGPDDTCKEITCATEADVEEAVYCSCRCDSGGTGFAECECPSGYSCVEVLEQGGPGVRGSYCVKSSTTSK